MLNIAIGWQNENDKDKTFHLFADAVADTSKHIAKDDGVLRRQSIYLLLKSFLAVSKSF